MVQTADKASNTATSSAQMRIVFAFIQLGTTGLGHGRTSKLGLLLAKPLSPATADLEHDIQ
jgi:hypothetical protein